MFCQVRLTSSSSKGYICDGSHITFNCEATGNFLNWFLNGDAIINYPAMDNSLVQRYEATDIYSALLSGDNGMLISELVFMVSPDPPSFRVECSGSGVSTTGVTIDVLGKDVCKGFIIHQ